MPHDPHAEIDHAMLDRIELSSNGVIPRTPAYQDSLKRLYATHQVYAHADHKDGHVTARSLAKQPVYLPNNLDALKAGAIGTEQVESATALYDRYVVALPAALRAKAEELRLRVVGKPIRHRPHHDGVVIHDPLHMLFLVPGAGPNPGLPMNYLHGAVVEHPTAGVEWQIQVRDREDGLAVADAASLAAALDLLAEVVACAPFHLSELDALGFKMV